MEPESLIARAPLFILPSLRYPTRRTLSIGPQSSLDAALKQEITPEQFSSFLEWLNPDFERAGEEYERLRFRLCRFFSLRGCNFADELADETINRVVLKISAEKIDNKMA